MKRRSFLQSILVAPAVGALATKDTPKKIPSLVDPANPGSDKSTRWPQGRWYDVEMPLDPASKPVKPGDLIALTPDNLARKAQAHDSFIIQGVAVAVQGRKVMVRVQGMGPAKYGGGFFPL